MQEVYEQQKELILLGERVVLATLGFDLNVQHPYKPLVEAIKKFKVAQNALAQVAWNFVNDGYEYDASEHIIRWHVIFSLSLYLTLEIGHVGCGHLCACNLSHIILQQVPFFLLLSSLK